ncbi:MAG: zinc transporter ZntB [Planctomycetes bacterium]|nr:zinc transporter ZntB [Planctomycetota bacterium]
MKTLTPLQSLVLDGRGGARTIEPARSGERKPGEVLWLHLDYKDPASLAWLREQSGIDKVMIEALLADDPRPRSLVHGDALLVILRGANLNPGADPEDMVSLRLWVEHDRVLTFRHRRLISIQEVADQLAAGNGPTSAGDLLHEIVARLLSRIGTIINGIEESADELEELVLTAESRELRTRLSALRRQSIALRRFVAPQRDTIGRLHAERVTWLDDTSRARLRETADRTTRYIEDLDSARDRAAVTYEELSNRIAEQMNQTMYRLSIVAAIFLPLGLLTGLLGINVGGIPGTESPSAFTLVSVALVVIGLVQWWWFKRRKIV